MTWREDIMRRELRSVILEAAPGLTDCVWEPYQGPRPERPYASWRQITRGSDDSRLADDERTGCVTRQAHVQVQSVVVGQPYRLDYNYTSVSSTPTGASTLATVRDDLIAKINADRDPVTASIVDGDTLMMQGDNPGEMWRVYASGEFLEATEAPGSPIDIVTIMTAPQKMTASLNVFSKGTAAAGGTQLASSSSYARKIDTAFRKRRFVAQLSQANLSVTKIADAVNLDGITPSQDAFESRTATDYRIELPYWEADEVEEIGSVEVTISTDKGSSTFTV
jgi:hypothetical protein